MFDPSKYKVQAPLEENVPLKINGNKLYAWSKKRNSWIELSDRWQIVPEHAMTPTVYWQWEMTTVPDSFKLQGWDHDPLVKSFTDDEWEKLPELVKQDLIRYGYKRIRHETTVLACYAYTKAGHEFRNFRYINHQLVADVYR
jgi:hypothetical protein